MTGDELSREEIAEIEEELALVPKKQGACIEALKTVQRHRGWISDQAVAAIAELLRMSAEEVDSVATFYNLIFRKPVGRHVIFVCDSVSCWILRSERILQTLRQELGIDYGETTDDGRFTLLPIPCLGTCDRAPALMIDEDLHRDLRPEMVGQILARYP